MSENAIGPSWALMWGGVPSQLLRAPRAVKFDGGDPGPGRYLDGALYADRDRRKKDYQKLWKAAHPNYEADRRKRLGRPRKA